MDAAGLQRLGIVLTTVAGLLLAPDLVGRRRLERIEAWAEVRTTRFHNQLADASRSIPRMWDFPETAWPKWAFQITAVVGLALYVPVRASELGARLAGRWIRGHDAVVGTMTILGLVAFFAGNVLQFIGTD